MATLHLVSHTHWDREWYLTYQQFRLKLVHLMDHLLAMFAAEPALKTFMLDGQAIALEDYLAVRPEREPQIRALVIEGRLLIGPWYVLPDEFLVSPEAIIRNWLQGERSCREFGGKMAIGYLPDTFGHNSQMPQILRGFDIDSACVWRGLGDEPCELIWESPDGSRVFLAYLRNSYSNAAGLPINDHAKLLFEVMRLRDSLAPHSSASHLLLMHGTDHMEPPPGTPAAFSQAMHIHGDRLEHSNLPAFLDAVCKEIAERSLALPIMKGELRACNRTQLLPGVLSTRIWIKQRNHACQILLEKWAEPFSTWAAQASPSQGGNIPSFPSQTASLHLPHGDRLENPAPLIREAWRLLLECHAHDSICGCAIDQVHDEMRPRFDQVEQIAEEITRQSLVTLSVLVDTASFPDKSNAFEVSPEPETNLLGAIVVFNPVSGPRNDWVNLEFELPRNVQDFEIIDDESARLPYNDIGAQSRPLIDALMDRDSFASALGMIHQGRVAGMAIQQVTIQRQADEVQVSAVLSEGVEADLSAWERGLDELRVLLTDPTVTQFAVQARSAPAAQISFVARGVPGYGYRTFWIREISPAGAIKPRTMLLNPLARRLIPLVSKAAGLPMIERLAASLSKPATSKPPYRIENETLAVEFVPEKGWFTLSDKLTGAFFSSCNRFMDGGDCGDEYNYAPPETDLLMEGVSVCQVEMERRPDRQTLKAKLELLTPKNLSPDRKTRSKEKAPLEIETCVMLYPGIHRVEFSTEILNRASDHRLRVHFDTPFKAKKVEYDGHFDILQRPVGTPPYDENWIEQPRPEAPQRAFTCLSGEGLGLALANRGLPEVEAIHTPSGNHAVALTLLRCVGWLSRDDFATRKGNAGPSLPVPGAQMIGRHTFEYALVPFGDDAYPAMCSAWAYNAPMRGLATNLHPGSLPSKCSMISIDQPRFVISAIKKSEDNSGWLVRGYNTGSEPILVGVKPWKVFKQASEINLAEKPFMELEWETNGQVSLPVGGHQIVTVRFV